MERMRKAKKALDGTLIRARFWAADRMERFWKEEKGDTNFVSIIVLIVIILAIAGVFRTQLTAAVNQVFEQLMEFIGGGEG